MRQDSDSVNKLDMDRSATTQAESVETQRRGRTVGCDGGLLEHRVFCVDGCALVAEVAGNSRLSCCMVDEKYP